MLPHQKKKTPQIFIQKKLVFPCFVHREKKLAPFLSRQQPFSGFELTKHTYYPLPHSGGPSKLVHLSQRVANPPHLWPSIETSLVVGPKSGGSWFFFPHRLQIHGKALFLLRLLRRQRGGVRRWLLYVRIWWSAPGGDTSAVIFFPSAPSVPVTLQVGVISQELVVSLGG